MDVPEQRYMSPAIDPVTQADANRQAAEVERQRPSNLEAVPAAFELDNLAFSGALGNLFTEPEDDPEFRMDAQAWAQVSQDIPAEFHTELAQAGSIKEAMDLRESILKARENEQLLAQAGVRGVGLRVLASVLDPVAIAASVATEGVAAPAILGTKATRLGRAVQAGLASGVTNAGIETALWANQPSRDAANILYGMAGGMVLGGALGGIRKPAADAPDAPVDDFRRASGDLQREIDAREAEMLNPPAPGTREAVQQAQNDYYGLIQRRVGGDTEVTDEMLQAAEARMRGQSQQRTEATRPLQMPRPAIDDGRHPNAHNRAIRQDPEYQRMRREFIHDAESFAAHSYADNGQRSIGYGFNLVANKQLFKRIMNVDEAEYQQYLNGSKAVTQQEAERLFDGIVDDFERVIDKRFEDVPLTPRQRAGLVSMAYVGPKLITNRLVSAIKSGDADRIWAAVNEKTDRWFKPELRNGVRNRRAREFWMIMDRDSPGWSPPVPGERGFMDAWGSSVGGPTRSDFGADTAGAARVGGTDEYLLNGDPNTVTPDVRNAEGGWATDVRFDVTGRLLGSELGISRWAAAKLGEDPVGRAGVTEPSAVLIADNRYNQAMTMYGRVHELAYSNWQRTRGLGKVHNWRASREQFNREVSDAIRFGVRPDTDPDVAKVARVQIEQQSRLVDDVSRSGVRGFEEVRPDKNYLTRLWRPDRISALAREITPEGVQDLIAAALRKGSRGMDEALSRKIAKHVYTRFRRQDAKMDVTDINRSLFSNDPDLIAKVLREAEADEDTIGEVLEQLTAKSRAENRGLSPRAKSRMDLDEDTTIYSEYAGREVHISELFENDAEKLFGNYARHMSGLLGLAKKGFRSDADFNKLIRTVRAEADRFEVNADGDVRRLEFLHKAIMGRPVDDWAGTKLGDGARMLQTWNYNRQMGQVGFAQIAEVGSIGGTLGWRNALSHMRDVRQLITRTKNGEVNSPLINEMEEILGVYGDDMIANPVTFRGGDFNAAEASTLQGAVGAFDTALQYTARGVTRVSGFRSINLMLHRVAAAGIGQKFLQMALKPNSANMKRMLSIGLDQPMLDRVLKQVKDHHASKPNLLTGRKLTHLNLDQWDDAEALEAFQYAVARWSGKIVQRNFAGEGTMWMSQGWGKILGQFRSFMMTAYSKQLLYNLRMADRETFGVFMGSMFFAGMAYYVQTTLNGIGRPDQKEFYRERLAPEEVAKAAFQRAGFASILPSVIDTVGTWTPLMNEPVFRYGRSTGLASNILLGNPTVDLVNKVYDASSAVMKAPIRSDYDWSQEDQRNLWGTLAFANAIGIRNLNELMLEDLPRQSTQTTR